MTWRGTDVLNATLRQDARATTDGRHKYFVKLHGRHYPIKQVVQLVPSLGLKPLRSST